MVAIATPLAYLYFSFLTWFASNPSLFPSGPLEQLILITQVLRLIVIMSLRRLRRAELPVIIIIGSVEMLIVPFLALLYLIINDPAYISIVGGISRGVASGYPARLSGVWGLQTRSNDE